MNTVTYLYAVVCSALLGAVGISAAGVWYIASDFLNRVNWEGHATLRGKAKVTVLWTHDHTHWGRMPKTAAYGAAIFGGGVAVLIPLLIGLHSILLG